MINKNEFLKIFYIINIIEYNQDNWILLILINLINYIKKSKLKEFLIIYLFLFNRNFNKMGNCNCSIDLSKEKSN